MTQLEAFRHLIQDDLEAVDHRLYSCFGVDVALIQKLSEHLITGGGKRMRPLVHILCARALGYEGYHHLKRLGI